VINADVDMVLRSRDTHDSLRPFWLFPDIVNIGLDRRFEFLASACIGLAPVGPVLASRDLGFALVNCIPHGIAFLLNLSLSLL
jgi:hypothetical protein